MLGEHMAQPAPKPRRVRIWPLVALGTALFFLFGGLGYYLASLFSLPGVDFPIPGIEGRLEPLNLLVIGSDQRQKEPGRADTLMVVFLDPELDRVSVLSIPRDTLAHVPGHGQTKIAHAHAYGGPELAMKAVEELLGIPIDHYLEVNFEGFIAAVDALGGVEIEVDQRMYYPQEGINLKPGRQRLNGKDALAFVRFRGYPEGDIERIRHQQEFLLALAEEALGWKGLLKSPQLVQTLYSCVRTDLSLAKILTLAKGIRDLTPQNVYVALLPGTPSYVHGVSYWVPDYSKLKATLAELQGSSSNPHHAQAKEPEKGI
jgi:LCP family protein required for cell wall assembly